MCWYRSSLCTRLCSHHTHFGGAPARAHPPHTSRQNWSPCPSLHLAADRPVLSPPAPPSSACVSLFGEPALASLGDDPGLAWRVALGLGALPGLLLAPFKTADARPVRRRLERVELVQVVRDSSAGQPAM